MGLFSNAQGQLTPQYLVESCQISNSFETIKLFLLPARMKKIQSKMKALLVHRGSTDNLLLLRIFSDVV